MNLYENMSEKKLFESLLNDRQLIEDIISLALDEIPTHINSLKKYLPISNTDKIKLTMFVISAAIRVIPYIQAQ